MGGIVLGAGGACAFPGPTAYVLGKVLKIKEPGEPE